MCVSQYITPLIGLVTGTLIGVFAEPIRTWIYRPVLKASFKKIDSCVTRTPIGTGSDLREGFYIRAKVENRRWQMAKSCRAYLVKVEQKNSKGDFGPTIFADSLPLNWSNQRREDNGRPIDLPFGVSQFVDVISTDQGAPGIPVVPPTYTVHAAMPFRYGVLFDNGPKILRLTILVTGDGVKAATTKIVFDWRKHWEKFEVSEG